MKPMIRFCGGGFAGAALLLVVSAAAPPAVRADDGGLFCDETENFQCCCETDNAGKLVGCICVRKGT